MTRVLKTLLIWLLMAALPVQGLAAAMKASCGPAHHAAAPMVAAAVAMAVPMAPAAEMTDLHHHDGARDHHGDHHSHDHAAAAHAAHSAADTSASGSGMDKASAAGMHKSSYCSACAACCVGAVAPPSVALSIPVYRDSESVVIPPTSPVTGYIPAGPERPPRHISA